MVEYLETSQLAIEVWGSQKDTPKAAPAGKQAGKAAEKKGGKSTKELMAEEKAKVCYFSPH